MESLWRETFGDSQSYVSLVFDKYFCPELIAYSEEDGEIRSALLGVPYEFHGQQGSIPLRGLYLCGLATREAYRRKGIMSRLLEEINSRALQQGFDFTFLIPASSLTRRYYESRGYHDAFFNVISHYVHGHDFDGNARDLHFKVMDEADIGQLTKWLVKYRKNASAAPYTYYIWHTETDWEAVLQESLISQEPVYVALKDGNPVGVAFLERDCTDGESENFGTLTVKAIVAEGEEFEKALLGHVSSRHPGMNISVVRSLANVIERGEDTPSVWQPFVAHSNPPEAEYEDLLTPEQPYSVSNASKPYGMIRILSVRTLLAKLQHIPSDSKATDFDDYSDADLVSLLLRHPQTPPKDDLLTSALHIPPLTLSISLLLD